MEQVAVVDSPAHSSPTESRAVALGGTGPALVSAYDRVGRLVSKQSIAGSNPKVFLAPGGFTVLTR